MLLTREERGFGGSHRAESSPVEQQTGEKSTSGVSAGDCYKKAERDNRSVRESSLLRDQNGSNGAKGESVGPAAGSICVQDAKSALRMTYIGMSCSSETAAAFSSAHAVLLCPAG